MDKNGRVGVLGAGTLGLRIAYLLARGGQEVLVKLLPEESPEKALEQIRAIAREGWNCQDEPGADTRVGFSKSWEDFSNMETVIEAIPEELALKQEFFRELEPRLPEDCVILSNSSSLAPSLIFDRLQRPGRAGALHFFLPAEAIRTVELAPHPQSDEASLGRAAKLMESVGYRVFTLNRESPGLVWNRINYHYTSVMLDAQQRLQLDRDQMDALFALGPGLPAHWLLDFIGLDIIRQVGINMRQQLGHRYWVPELLEEKVVAGELGVKVGQGFWAYPGCCTDLNPWNQAAPNPSSKPPAAADGPETNLKVMVLGSGPYGLFLASLFSLRGASVKLVTAGWKTSLGARAALKMVRTKLAPLYGRPDTRPGKVQVSSNGGSLTDLDMVFEALPDDLSGKRLAFQGLLQNLPDGIPVALGSPLFSVADTADGLEQAGSLLGGVRLHGQRTTFDLFPGPATNPDILDRARSCLQRLGCNGLVLPDGAGRPTEIAFAAASYEYLRLLEEGVMSRSGMDELLRAVNTPVDFSFLLDEAGFDYLLNYSRCLGPEWSELFQPPALLEHMVQKGYLGLKNGRGLARYLNAHA